MKTNKNIFFIAITTFIFTFGFAIRLWKLNTPLADWHSWRQADTAAIARNFIRKDKAKFFVPRCDDLSNVATGYDNPEGYRFLEVPIYNYLHAKTYLLSQKISNKLTFEGAGRLVSAVASIISALFLMLIVNHYSGRKRGLLTASVFLLIPFNIYYSRTILPGPTMVCFSLISIYLLILWQKSRFKKSSLLVGSALLAMIALLVKPYAIFLIAPACSLIILPRYFQDKKDFLLTSLAYGLISILPLVVWRLWIKNFPEGIPANQWLFNLGGMRLRPAWWRWLFGERLGRLILGVWGLIPFAIGLMVKRKKESLYYSLLLSIFTYLVIFARGNIEHDYYQIITIPIISIFVAKGILFLFSPPKKVFRKLVSWGVMGLTIIMALGLGWYQIRDYYQINNPSIVEAGRKIDQLAGPDDKVVAPYNGDTAFLYQTNRKGWPFLTEPIEPILKQADYYVSTTLDPITAKVKNRCSVIEENPNWVIIDLKDCYEKK